MNINSISPVSCKASVKKLATPLKDGKTFHLSLSDNYFNAFITKGQKLIEGTGYYNRKGYANKLNETLERIRPNVEDGIDFLKEFVAAVLK